MGSNPLYQLFECLSLSLGVSPLPPSLLLALPPPYLGLLRRIAGQAGVSDLSEALEAS